MSIATGNDAPAGARLTVDLGAVAANWRLLADAAPGAETGAAVKADAYGIGLAAATGALWAAGCRTFFVALPAEGVTLRAALPDATIHVLNGYLGRAAALYRRHRLSPVLGDLGEIDAWLADAGPDAPLPVLHVDTGMNRLGLSLDQARGLASDPSRVAALRPALVMSHFACADRPDHPHNAMQIARFAEVRALFPGVRGSLANSAGIALGPAAHHDLTRPGVALFGGRSGADHPVRPVVSIEARILTVRDVPPGGSVGYGATAAVDRPSRIAVVSAGYADGLQRRLGPSGGHAAIGGVRVPLIGRISMDLMALDVTDLPHDAVGVGALVELIGPTVTLAEVADRCGTIDYEILTSLGRRYERRYIP